jgi:CDP-paratose 2-epimerase
MNVFITGGAGFIGSNAASYFLKKGDSVTIFDNFSRKGGASNESWLSTLGGNLTVVRGDITKQNDLLSVQKNIRSADLVLHLAAQVAVTTSVTDPRNDFHINAYGTLNVLEAMRQSKSHALLIYSSTNKVYGGMEDVKVVEKPTRYEYADFPFGVDEERPLDFHSPYGCSKGAADQYVHDYARIYGFKTVVFRQSCIYGPRQFGVEDQGWVAWFIIAAVLGKPMTIYGDGKQVRDLLYVDDLVRAYDLAYAKRSVTSGNIYNVGGGNNNIMAVWSEFKPILETILGKKLNVVHGDWRPGDQKIFVADIRKAQKEFGWSPRVSVPMGVEKLFNWVSENKTLFV